ncbi:MAG: hypothetical protein JWM31_1349 [Solirubrobacterales bacterium]|nr:hypothetical protein [Solirubrobacterales bacterium]
MTNPSEDRKLDRSLFNSDLADDVLLAAYEAEHGVSFWDGNFRQYWNLQVLADRLAPGQEEP